MNTIQELISKFPEKRILVIGDVIIDQYIYGTATGLSAETPTVVAKELETKTSIGGAFLLVRNLQALGAKVKFYSVVGWDFERYRMILFHRMFVNPAKMTTSKKRYWIDNYKLLQMDVLDNPELDSFQECEFDKSLNSDAAGFDSIVVSDYRHGLLSPTVVESVKNIAKEHKKPLYVDSQISRKLYSESNYEQYKGADVFCMNLREAQFTDPTFLPGPGDPGNFACLHQKLDSNRIVVKLGERGCEFSTNKDCYRQGGFQVNTVDTCGAGDAFLAALCLCDLENSPAESLRIANAWAALSTTIHGTEPAKKEQLLELLETTK